MDEKQLNDLKPFGGLTANGLRIVAAYIDSDIVPRLELEVAKNKSLAEELRRRADECDEYIRRGNEWGWD